MTTLIQTYHDDWIVNVQLSNGNVYSFMTEMWYEHGDSINWPAVEREAYARALDLNSRHVDPFAVVTPEVTTKQALSDALNATCMVMSDSQFQRLMR